MLLRSNLAYRTELAEPRSSLQARSVFIWKPLVSPSMAESRIDSVICTEATDVRSESTMTPRSSPY